MNKQYVKQCPYCNSTSNRLIFNPEVSRMVSKCNECSYSGTTIFKDVEKNIARSQTVRVNK